MSLGLFKPFSFHSQKSNLFVRILQPVFVNDSNISVTENRHVRVCGGSIINQYVGLPRYPTITTNLYGHLLPHGRTWIGKKPGREQTSSIRQYRNGSQKRAAVSRTPYHQVYIACVGTTVLPGFGKHQNRFSLRENHWLLASLLSD